MSTSIRSLAASSDTLQTPHFLTSSLIAISMNLGFLYDVVMWFFRSFSEALSEEGAIMLPSWLRSFEFLRIVGVCPSGKKPGSGSSSSSWEPHPSHK